MSDFDILDAEYMEQFDITKFCASLQEAWKSSPDLHFGSFLNIAFDGYNLNELTPDEMQEMLDEFILQSMK